MIQLFKSKRTKAAESKISELEKNIQTLKRELDIKESLLYQAQSKIVSNNTQNVQDQKQTCTEQSHLKIVSDEPTPQPDTKEPHKEDKKDAKLSDELKSLLNELGKVKMSRSSATVLGIGCLLVGITAVAALAVSIDSTTPNNTTK